MDLGIISWTPFVPSTTCVTWLVHRHARDHIGVVPRQVGEALRDEVDRLAAIFIASPKSSWNSITIRWLEVSAGGQRTFK